MGEQGTKLTVDEQQIILEYMRQGTIEYIKYLPYFYSSEPNHIKGETAVKLIEALSYNFDENDPNVQQQLYLTLDKIFDGVIRLKYEEDKVNFKLKDKGSCGGHNGLRNIEACIHTQEYKII